METAIILDGHLKSALTIVRSLGQKGIRVMVGSERKTSISAHSRYTIDSFVYPSPQTSPDAFFASVLEGVKNDTGIPILYTSSDSTFLALYARRNELQGKVRFVVPEDDAVELVFNKAATYSFAKVHGVPTIPTYIPSTMEECRRLAHTFTYPVIVKPRRTVTMNNGVGVFGSAELMLTEDVFLSRYGKLLQKYGEAPLIQDYIHGEEYGVEMIAHKGAPLGLVTHHRIRSLSPLGGASVLKEVLQEGTLRSELESHALRLVSKLEWEGPIMCEFKVDSDTGTTYLMEINGRFWGSLPLSVKAGVDMPYLHYLLATGADIPLSVSVPRVPTVTRHFLGDCFHLLRVLFSITPLRTLVYPTRMKALQDFFNLPQGTRGDIGDWRDPLPGIMEPVDALVKYLWK